MVFDINMLNIGGMEKIELFDTDEEVVSMKKIFILLILSLSFFNISGCKDEVKIFTPGLTWDVNIKAMSWPDAVNYCKNKGMTLPSKKELIAGYKSKQKDLNKQKESFWSSSTLNDNPSRAWVVDFANGNVFSYNRDYSYYVRCVSR